MGNGRNGYRWVSAYSNKVVAPVTKKPDTTKSRVRTNAEYANRVSKHGYELKRTRYSISNYSEQMERTVANFETFAERMGGETMGTVQLRGTTRRGLRGSINSQGDVSLYINTRNGNANFADTTLAHEHAHNLVRTLITKELGYKRTDSEFMFAYIDSKIEESVSKNAFNKWKTYMSKHGRDVSADTIETAVTSSGMRDYAIHNKWSSYDKPVSFTEVPSVASEKFLEAGYNWKTLLHQSPYSYFVLQELYGRLHKKKG